MVSESLWSKIYDKLQWENLKKIYPEMEMQLLY